MQTSTFLPSTLTTAPHPDRGAAGPRRAPRSPAAAALPPPPRATMTIHLLLGTLLFASAWFIGRMSGLIASREVNYWIGVAGGVTMLLLFLYPLRKHWRVLRHAGRTRPWFIGHMVLGIAGPWLILVHSAFRLGSLNASVALAAMLVVASSGVVGRFLYVRVHLGLDGEKAALDELRRAWQEGHARWDPVLAAAPAVRDRLAAFERSAIDATSVATAAAAWHRLLRLRREARRTLDACRPMLDEALAALAQPTDARERRRLLHLWRAGVREHVGQVLRVAQYSAWERLFSLWHVLHVPFVWVMVICAFAHIFAVHAY